MVGVGPHTLLCMSAKGCCAQDVESEKEVYGFLHINKLHKHGFY